MEESKEDNLLYFYRIRFRDGGQQFTASSPLKDLRKDEVAMVRGEYGLEPACVVATAPACRDSNCERKASYELARRATHEECKRYEKIPGEEESAFSTSKKIGRAHV